MSYKNDYIYIRNLFLSVKNPETLSNMFLMIKIMNSSSLEIFISTDSLLLAQTVFSLSEIFKCLALQTHV